jgi:hypothetical protein
MTTAAWLVPTLALAMLVGYVWGRSGLFRMMVRDFAFELLGKGIVELVRMEPWFQWRGLTGVIARGLTWISWGAFLFLLGGIITAVFIVFATVLLIFRCFRDGFRGPAPFGPDDPVPSAGLAAYFYRLLRPRTPDMDAPARPKLVRRASAGILGHPFRE